MKTTVAEKWWVDLKSQTGDRETTQPASSSHARGKISSGDEKKFMSTFISITDSGWS